MQQYNTQLPLVKLPEYGRHVQQLVAYCKTIPDRDRRTRYAYGIVSIMGDLYPQADKVENLQQVLWDHFAMLSGYELDIDYPVAVIPREQLQSRPEPLPTAQHERIERRMYGKQIEELVDYACNLPEADQRIRLFERCANHMKLHFHVTHPTADEDDQKIIHDLMDYARGRFQDEILQVYLYSLDELKVNTQYDPATLTPAPTKKKKKKKKKKNSAQ